MNQKIHILLTCHSERNMNIMVRLLCFFFLDPSKMYPDAEVLDYRIKGGVISLMSQLLSGLNGIPIMVWLWHCWKELLLKILSIHLWISEIIQEDIWEGICPLIVDIIFFCWHSFTNPEIQDNSQSFIRAIRCE